MPSRTLNGTGALTDLIPVPRNKVARVTQININNTTASSADVILTDRYTTDASIDPISGSVTAAETLEIEKKRIRVAAATQFSFVDKTGVIVAIGTIRFNAPVGVYVTVGVEFE